MYRLVLYILFFSLPLLHGQLWTMLGGTQDWGIAGNYEFTKSIFFILLVSIAFLIFVAESLLSRKKIFFPKELLFPASLLGIFLCFSQLFSLSPELSFFGSPGKGHGIFLFFHLFLLFVMLLNTEKQTQKKLIFVLYISVLGVSFFAIKEYFFPSFDYGNLSDRALGTFGHPNYLAGYLLLLVPLLYKQKDTSLLLYLLLLASVCITIIYSLSFWAIFIVFCYTCFTLISKKISEKKSLFLLGCIIIILGITSLVGVYFGLLPIEKIHSFLSRFFIWETLLHIIASSPKIFLFGGGLETLPHFFSSFKVPEMYIYENFGFTADRAHNIFLGFIYHIGVLGALGVYYVSSKILKKIRDTKNIVLETLLVFGIFGIFHFYSISAYAILLLIVMYYGNWEKFESKKILIPTLTLLGVISFVSLYKTSSLFVAEIYAYQKDFSIAYDIFPTRSYLSEFSILKDSKKDELYYENQIRNLEKVQENCEKLTVSFPSVENYFYCGKILEKLGYSEQAMLYYQNGLKKLPDLRNTDSPYWDDFFIKNTVSGNRFFSEKFSEIEKIVEKFN